MIHMVRKVKCQYVGPDKYLREGIVRDKAYPVIGYEARKIEKEFDGKKQWVEELFYILIDAEGKTVTMAAFNFKTKIDESAEIPGGQLIGMMNNILTMLKVLSEKFTGKDNGKGSKNSD